MSFLLPAFSLGRLDVLLHINFCSPSASLACCTVHYREPSVSSTRVSAKLVLYWIAKEESFLSYRGCALRETKRFDIYFLILAVIGSVSKVEKGLRLVIGHLISASCIDDFSTKLLKVVYRLCCFVKSHIRNDLMNVNFVSASPNTTLQSVDSSLRVTQFAEYLCRQQSFPSFLSFSFHSTSLSLLPTLQNKPPSIVIYVPWCIQMIDSTSKVLFHNFTSITIK